MNGTRQREIVFDPAPCGPPLMLVSKGHLTDQAIRNLRASWELAWRGDAPGPKIIAIEGGMKVFQLIGDRWVNVEEPADAECRPVPSADVERTIEPTSAL